MARFLSREWFYEVAPPAEAGDVDAAGDADEDPDAGHGGDDRLVLEQVVLGTPDGEVRYRVVLRSGRARILPAMWTESAPADLTFTCDWATATAIAQGLLPAQTALMQGRLRIRGSVSRISGQAQQLIGLDPVPEEIRRRTTY
jgi:hypothetical protein